MSNVFNIYEFKHAKEVVKEVPLLINMLSKMDKALSSYGHYKDIQPLLDQIFYAQFHLGMQLEYYKKVYERKAKQLKGDRSEY
jgi:hypothetical protein